MIPDKKFQLTDEYIIIGNKRLYRIEARIDFSNVKKGDKGGFVESEQNLSNYGDCWIYDNAKVYGKAKIYNDVQIFDNVEVYGNAVVYENAKVFNNAKIYDNARVHGCVNIMDNVKIFNDSEVYGHALICCDAIICGNAKIFGNAEIRNETKISSNSDYMVFKNWWSNGIYFTWTRSNNMWKVGSFYGTGQELITKAYKKSKLSGKEYERVVKYVESILYEQ